jgi:chemotaxis protein methyltransferase CheR
MAAAPGRFGPLDLLSTPSRDVAADLDHVTRVLGAEAVLAVEAMGTRPDADCVAFLQWALPRMGLRWAGFRRVRRQVCRRLRGRVAELGLPGLPAYRARLLADPREWAVLDGLTPITISRFARDRAVHAALEHDVVPALAAAARADGRERLRAWSAGCASGEEPASLALLWNLALAAGHPGLTLAVLATDVGDAVLERARRAVYEPGSLRELPAPWIDGGFDRRPDGTLALRAEHRALVTVRRHDVRAAPPDGAAAFDLVLCRNLAFTYFAPAVQRAVLAGLATALRPGGALVIGLHERLPGAAAPFAPWPDARAVLRRA